MKPHPATSLVYFWISVHRIFLVRHQNLIIHNMQNYILCYCETCTSPMYNVSITAIFSNTIVIVFIL